MKNVNKWCECGKPGKFWIFWKCACNNARVNCRAHLGRDIIKELAEMATDTHMSKEVVIREIFQ